jgi:hypothetical protein
VNVRSISTVIFCTSALLVMNMANAYAECIW